MAIKFLVFLLMLSNLAQADDTSKESELGFKLASLETNENLSKSDIRVARAIRAISDAESVCAESDPVRLVDQAVNTADMLKKNGIYSSAVDILEGLKAILFDYKEKQDCMKTLYYYFQGRSELDFNHSQAVAALHILVVNGNKLAEKPESKKSHKR